MTNFEDFEDFDNSADAAVPGLNDIYESAPSYMPQFGQGLYGPLFGEDRFPPLRPPMIGRPMFHRRKHQRAGFTKKSHNHIKKPTHSYRPKVIVIKKIVDSS